MAKLTFAHRAFLVLLLAPTVAACSTLGTASTLISSDSKGLAGPSAEAIAKDLSGHLVDHLAPRTSTIAIIGDGSEFALALESSLRQAGYAITADKGARLEGLSSLYYMVDEMDGQIMVRIAAPTVRLARLYQLTSDGAKPTSPLSVRSDANQEHS